MSFFISLANALPKLKKPIQISGFIILIAAFIATRFATPSQLPTQVAAGTIGIVFLALGQAFHYLLRFPAEQRVLLVLGLFVLAVLLAAALLLFVLVQTGAIDPSHTRDKVLESLNNLDDADIAPRSAAITDLFTTYKARNQFRSEILDPLADHLLREQDRGLQAIMYEGFADIGPDSVQPLLRVNKAAEENLARAMGSYAGLLVSQTMKSSSNGAYSQTAMDEHTPFISIYGIIDGAIEKGYQTGPFRPNEEYERCGSPVYELGPMIRDGRYNSVFQTSRKSAWEDARENVEPEIESARGTLLAASHAYSITVIALTKLLEHLAGHVQNLRFEGVSLFDADLRGLDLSGIDLKGADLTESQLTEAILERADMRNATLKSTCLGGANLKGALLDDAYFGPETLSNIAPSQLKNTRFTCNSWQRIDSRSDWIKPAIESQAAERCS